MALTKKLFLRLLLTLLPLAGGVTAQPVEDSQGVRFDRSEFGKVALGAFQANDNNNQFEQSIGDYNNESVKAYGESSPVLRIGRPVGRLDVLTTSGDFRTCTGFLVGEGYLLTSAACVTTGPEDHVMAAQFVAGYIDPGVIESAKRYTVLPAPAELDEQIGVAVMRVLGSPSAEFGRLSLTDERPIPGDFAWVLGHPMGASQHIAREGCNLGGGSPLDVGLLHSCDTLPGNEGSPIISLSDRRVVGLHLSGDNRDSLNRGVTIAEIFESPNLRVLFKAGSSVGGPDPDKGPGGPHTIVPQACRSLWAEAKALGCVGYNVYLSECPDDAFATLARHVLQTQCTSTETATPDKGHARDCATLGVTGPCLDITAATAALAQRGYAFNAPETMQLGQVTTLSLVLDTDEDNSETLALAGATGPVRTGQTPVSFHMEAELKGGAFDITPGGRQRLQISALNDTRWDWQVTPIWEGDHVLQLVLYVIFQDIAAGEVLAEERAIAKPHQIAVTVTAMQRVISAVQQLDPLVASMTTILAALGALLAWFGVKNWAGLIGRKQEKPAPGPMQVEVTIRDGQGDDTTDKS